MSFSSLAGGASGGITNAKDFLDGKSLAKLSAKSAKGISGWEFDIPTNESVRFSSEVTDHVTENNSFISDHIVRKPVEITLSGFKGELVFERPGGAFGILGTLNNRLESVEAYLGDYTPGAIQEIQKGINKVDSAVNEINRNLTRAQNVVDFFSGEDQTFGKQQQAYNDIKALWLSDQALTVQTPWEYFDNMFITELSFTQDETTFLMTDISVTLKEVRFADIEFFSYEGDSNPIREKIQKDPT